MREADKVQLVSTTSDDRQVVVANDAVPQAFILESNVTPQAKSDLAFVTIGEDRPLVVQESISLVEIVSVGTQGPPGAQGVPGPAGGSSVLLEAGETIFGLRAVQAQGGLIFNADTSDVALAQGSVVGVALQSGGIGDDLLVQLSGELTENSWSWLPGYVYCGPDGSLTQSPSDLGWLITIGRVVSPTTIVVDIGQLFIRT